MIALYIIAAKYSEFIKKQSSCNIFINTANKDYRPIKSETCTI